MSTRTHSSKRTMRACRASVEGGPRQTEARKMRRGRDAPAPAVRMHGGRAARAAGRKGGEGARAFGGAALLLAGAAGAAGCKEGDVFRGYESVRKPVSDAMNDPAGIAFIAGSTVALVGIYFAIEYARQKARGGNRGDGSRGQGP